MSERQSNETNVFTAGARRISVIRLRRRRQPSSAPGAKVGEERHKRDRLLGERIKRLLLVGRVVRFRQHARIGELLQPVRHLCEIRLRRLDDRFAEHC